MIDDADSINPYWVLQQVELLKQFVGDFEAAHSMEDELHSAVLGHIANGTANRPEDCARAALTTEKLEFPRYCA